jgi:hypothetical protein
MTAMKAAVEASWMATPTQGQGATHIRAEAKPRTLQEMTLSASALTWGQELELEEFVEKYGEPFSKLLGIDLQSRRNGEMVKWFLASILYGKPIRESTATLTYRTFEAHGAVDVEGILSTGWDGLVRILDEGGYTRYDFSTATKLLEAFGNLKSEYAADLWNLYDRCPDGSELEKKLKGLGKGIGDTTVSIFLRDMRYIWPKARPNPSPLVRLAMGELGIDDLAKMAKRRGLDVVMLETALLRFGKDFLKKGGRVDVKVVETRRLRLS